MGITSRSNSIVVPVARFATSRYGQRIFSQATQRRTDTKASFLSVRWLASRPPTKEPTFESQDNDASKWLTKPAPGGYARSNFIRDRLGDTIEDNYEFADNDSIVCGGMSRVKGAFHKRTGKKVAIKIVEKVHSDHLQALTRELEILKTTDHPNIVRLHEVYEDEEKLCLVLQFCSGGTLLDHIRSTHKSGRGFDEEELKDLTINMLQAISYCHSHNIVHRDIKPTNFMFAPRLKLVDFGVSGVVPKREGSIPISEKHLQLYKANAPKRLLEVKTGTDGYIAPEILDNRRYGPSSDMFSLGATLFHMITGKPPMWLESLRRYHLPKSPRLQNLSAAALNFSARLLSPDPKVRPTAGEALKDPWLAKENETDFRHLDENRISKLQRHSMRSKLQRCVRTNYVVHTTVPEEDLVGFEDEFCSMVRTSMGEISKKDLKKSLRLRSSMEASNLLEALDAAGSESLSFSEWLVSSCSEDVFNDEVAARRAFETLDSDGDGFISAKDLYVVLPGVFAEQEILEEMGQHDLNNDGHIDFHEFCELLKQETTSQS